MTTRDTEQQRAEARQLMQLTEQAVILRTRINRIHLPARHLDLITATDTRARRRDAAFWQYVNENLTTLAGI